MLGYNERWKGGKGEWEGLLVRRCVKIEEGRVLLTKGGGVMPGACLCRYELEEESGGKSEGSERRGCDRMRELCTRGFDK